MPLSHTTAWQCEEKPLQGTGECGEIEGLNQHWKLKMTKTECVIMQYNNNVENAGIYCADGNTYTTHRGRPGRV